MAHRRWLIAALYALCVFCSSTAPVWAQDEELQLSVRRNVGYGGGSQIQGSFRMEATGPANLTSVTFKIDELEIAMLTQPPFRIDFSTEDYAPGWHNLNAVGQTGDGRTLVSQTRRFEFLSAEQAWQATQGIIIPMVSIIGVILILAMGVPMVLTFTGKKSNLPLGAPRTYGLLGGAICPKCGRPFGLHWWAFNINFIGKFDRCDHCGRWSLVRRVSGERLAEAEAAELRQAQPETPITGEDVEEKRRRQLDDTRYSSDV